MNMIMTMTEKERERAKGGAQFFICRLDFLCFFFFLSSYLANNNYLIVLCDLHVSQNNSTQ